VTEPPLIWGMFLVVAAIESEVSGWSRLEWVSWLVFSELLQPPVYICTVHGPCTVCLGQ
jgi:hypothetical protein